jgi:hypothetical protein
MAYSLNDSVLALWVLIVMGIFASGRRTLSIALAAVVGPPRAGPGSPTHRGRGPVRDGAVSDRPALAGTAR